MGTDRETGTADPERVAAQAGGSGLDSILALADIRRRMVAAHRQGARQPLRQILELDPLTILRLLRITRAPVHAFDRAPERISGLISAFGMIKVKRALEVAPVPTDGSLAVRQLWLHALATGHAARWLADTHPVDDEDPEAAYLRGLLIDLADWEPYLTEFGGRGSASFARLLAPWQPSVADRAERRRRAMDLAHGQCRCREDLLCKAELLADLAGFWHPADDDDPAHQQLLRDVSRDDLIAAQNLRSRIWGVLAQAHLRGAEHSPDPSLHDETEDLTLFEWRREKGSLADVVTSLQNCSAAFRYRGIITATTAASLRFLDYERAMLAVWNPDLQCAWVRAKSDMSPRRLEPHKVHPNPQELEVLRSAVELGIATRMVSDPEDPTGILDALGVDEMLCVPINPTFQSPSFLFLDRTLTRRPVIQGDDLKAVTALASTASMLTENLLLKKVGQRAKRFALTDPLTRLYNRGVGLATLERELARARRHQSALTVLMLDLDEFKNLNDQYGHVRGDTALRISADVLRKALRKQDTICRYGGEEFMVVLPDTDIEQASVIATRLFTEVEAAGLSEGLPLTVSIGLTEVSWEQDTVESILTRADHALYASKARGRNRFSVDSVDRVR